MENQSTVKNTDVFDRCTTVRQRVLVFRPPPVCLPCYRCRIRTARCGRDGVSPRPSGCHRGIRYGARQRGQVGNNIDSYCRDLGWRSGEGCKVPRANAGGTRLAVASTPMAIGASFTIGLLAARTYTRTADDFYTSVAAVVAGHSGSRKGSFSWARPLVFEDTLQ